MNQNWDAEQYTDHFSFVHRYGDDVAGLIDMNGVESILDLGCGNGALTARFHDRGVSVTGMDASEEMLQIARREHPEITFFLRRCRVIPSGNTCRCCFFKCRISLD